MRALIVAHVVTYNNAKTIERCLSSLLQQEKFELGSNYEVWVTDNASSDGTPDIIKQRFNDYVHFTPNTHNLGFSTAHNQAISRAISLGAEYVFIVNPDLRLENDALYRLVKAIYKESRVGCACPKLYRADATLAPVIPMQFDATGMYMTPSIRHFDRGSEETDYGQYDESRYVFGGSGAALLLKRDFILDVAYQHDTYLELFDDTFFAYREDADLAWRAQILGWKCLYLHNAVGFHKRVVLPSNRDSLPAQLNCLSVQNRFLMQLNNLSFKANFHCLISSSLRNLLVLIGVAVRERSSFAGLGNAWRHRRNARAHHKHSYGKRRISFSSLANWFSKTPYSEPVLLKSPISNPITSVAALVINHNSGDRLFSCLSSLRDASCTVNRRLDFQVVIIDNNSSDDSLKTVEESFAKQSNFHFEKLKRNIGFAGGINQGAKTCTADAYLLLNPDIEISGNDILSLVTSLEDYTNLAGVSPLLTDSAGAIQTNYIARRFPSLGSILAELFFVHRIFPNNCWSSRFFYRDDSFVHDYIFDVTPELSSPYEPRHKPLIVDQPAAACFLLRAEALQQIGGFDESFFPAWYEDVDACKRLHSQGLVCGISRKATAKHEGGYSKEEMPLALYYSILYRNLCHYISKHFSLRDKIAFKIAFPLAMICRAFIAFFQHDFSTIISNKRTIPLVSPQLIILAMPFGSSLLGKRLFSRHNL